jgi:Uma2 family endonuclease
MVAQPKIKTRMTADEYFALPESSQIIELIDGELLMVPPLTEHQMTSSTALIYLGKLVEEGKWFHAPTAVCLDDENTPEPDLFWLSPAHLDKITRKCIEGAPDLVIEIFSASTAYRDRGVKYALYEKFGVREYWMIDPASRFIEVYTLQNAAFVRHGVYAPGETFASPVFGGKTVDVAALFA